MENYFTILAEEPVSFWKILPVDVKDGQAGLTSFDDRGQDVIGQADIGKVVKGLCQALGMCSQVDNFSTSHSSKA